MRCPHPQNSGESVHNASVALFDNSMLTVEDLANYLKVPVKTIYDWVYRRQAPYYKVGRHLRFKMADIQAWLNERKSTNA